MKLYISLVLVLLVSMGIVLGAEIIELEGINEDDLFVDMFEGDAVSFSFMEDNHRIHVSNIHEGGVDVTFFINRDTEQIERDRLPSYVTLKPGDSVRIDVNKDRVNNLLVGLTKYDPVLKEATLLVRETRTAEEKRLDEVKFDDGNGGPTGDVPVEPPIDINTTINLVNIFTIILVLMVIVLGYLLIRKRD